MKVKVKIKKHKSENMGKQHEAQLMTVEEIIKTIEKMPYNVSISIADTCEYEPEGWWAITKIFAADTKILLFHWYGGGYIFTYSIDEGDYTETIKNAVISFISNDCTSFGDINEKYFVDTEVTPLKQPIEKNSKRTR